MATPSPHPVIADRSAPGDLAPHATTAALLLRALQHGDRPALRALLANTQSFSAAELAVALELFDEAFAPGGGEGEDQEQYAFVGAVDGASAERRLVGYACWGRTPATRATFDLYWLAVDPAQQGSGIGAALVHEVERRASAVGGRLMVIEASGRADNAAVRRFYERMGSTAVATVRDFYAPGDDRITYTKRLGATGSTQGSDDA